MSNLYKVAWSDFFNSDIMCVSYDSDSKWKFVLVDKKKNIVSRVYNNQSLFSIFDWHK